MTQKTPVELSPVPRVLQVALSLNPGGTERLLVELAGRLHPRMPTMVCCLDDAGAWAAELQAKGVVVVALDRKPGFRPSLGRTVAEVARRHRADVVHAHQYSPFVYAALAKIWRPRLPLVFTEHGRLSDAPPSSKRRLANRILTRFPGRVFAVSEDLKRHMVAEGFGAENVGVIYNGIDPGPLPDAQGRIAARKQLGVPEDTLVVGTIGRLDPVKDLATLLRALAQCSPEMQALLVIIGDGPERPVLEALARELSVDSRVRFLGHRDDARQWLPACDVYVNSSVSEGVSLTILEAMAAGLPVIATRVGGTPEVVTGECGLLVPARDAGALARALCDLHRDLPRRASFGRAARSRVETHFTLDRMVREYADVYRSLTAGAAGVRS